MIAGVKQDVISVVFLFIEALKAVISMYVRKRVRYGRIKKALHMATIIIVLVFIISEFQTNIHKNFVAEAISTKLFTEHVVSPGDTLWKIAVQYRPDVDPRETVWEIQELNGITPNIQPGQVILIPEVNTK